MASSPTIDKLAEWARSEENTETAAALPDVERLQKNNMERDLRKQVDEEYTTGLVIMATNFPR